MHMQAIGELSTAQSHFLQLYFSGYVESVEAYVEIYDREWKPMIYAMQDTEVDPVSY